jgi:hypothetical protein
MPILIAPTPYAQFQTRGASYTADANGLVVAAAGDVGDLLSDGCIYPQTGEGAVFPGKNTPITTVGTGTLTAAALVGGIITRSGSIAAYTDTTDTATAIIAAMANARVSEAWEFTLINTTAFQQTIVAGAGVTLTGLTAVIAGNCIGRFLASYTGAGAVSLQLLWVSDRGIDNFAATADPLVSNDNTQGYGLGSIWFNNTAGQLRSWECRSGAAGAAAWIFSGADYANGGTNPPTEVTQFGASTANCAAEGNVNRQISAVGINPGAIGADNVLAVYSIPGSAFDGAAGTNRGIAIQANGSFANNTNTKRVKIIVNPATAVVGSTVGAGGVTLADSQPFSTTGAAGWQMNAEVYKYGAAGSNTQIGIPGGTMIGPTHGGLGAGVLGTPQAITAVESGAILVAVTGNATTAVTDISFNYLTINGLN